MAAKIIEEGEAVEVTSLCVVIFGPPGNGKTALAQTAENPLTLDFDRGSHRAFNRKRVVQFDSFSDANDPTVVKAVKDSKTIIVDTAGRLLDTLAIEVIAENVKHGTRGGGLALQGWGVLKQRFANWMKGLTAERKDVILICHEKEEKDGDERFFRPDIQGASYGEVAKLADMIGHLSIDMQGKRTLNFSPTDRHTGKNAAGFDPIPVPKLEDHPQFMARLLADAKARISGTAKKSAEVEDAVGQWMKWLESDPTMDELNACLPDIKQLPKPAFIQAFSLFEKYGKIKGWEWNKTRKTFEALT